MCGFAGVIAFDERYRCSAEQLARMSASVAHRGPDGEGSWISAGGDISTARPHAALAHRRLAILDPDPRANQPFADARGRQLVFNGEIYNFRELRKELSSLRPDDPWRTECDTEVLLAAYDAWGERCVEKFDGMFAFALWDAPAGALFLARDRMGQKPLYLAVAPPRSGAAAAGGAAGAIAFASELSALRVLPWVDASTDFSALGHYLRWGYIPAPLTICQGCQKLPPARWMRVRAGGVEVERYFDPNDAGPDAPSTGGTRGASGVGGDVLIGSRVRDVVTSAVRRQLISDVPLGCFLSGGIDSSIVAAAMKTSAPRGQDVLTFSIGFDDPRYDETRHAAEVARHLGTRHQQFTVRPDAAADLPKLARVFAEPFGDSSALPTHYLAREARRHVKVALSGDGGDELFGGYDRYRALWLTESFAAMPPRLRQIATSKLWERLPGGAHPKSKVARVKRMLASIHLSAGERYDSYVRLFDDATAAELLPDEAAVAAAPWLGREFAALADGRDVVRTAMALDRVTYLPDDLHCKVDRAAMLHALEVRSPFMDPAVVSFAAGLSTEDLFGVRGGRSAFMQSPMTAPAKRLLREAFAADLPPTVFKRPKMGFAVPIGDWLRTDLRPLLHDALTASGSFASRHLHRPTINRLLSEHDQQRQDHAQRLYALLMLELWWRVERA
ncbi:MAG TPA: asparagine synthase (glutamine-hydrolyzing) [Tepidisphaeraceae bacterium]|nr:asparagine synthase (glutamine-hydrolyzing) [Tepidisphaeraceae bacterium]